MRKLFLYAVFHANLSFSSIPRTNYANVIDCCYWPLLELIKAGHKLAIEFPSSTLRTIHDIDPSFIRELSLLWKEGKCDVIGSGFNQNIFPLIPVEVNRANLEIGMRDYESLLGRRPDLAFVNEQTYSGGLPSLYAQAGFKGIVMDWDNASEYNDYNPELRYRPVAVEGVDGVSLPIVWNSSLNSYKFQRCIYGRMTTEQFMDEVLMHFPPADERALPIYGTDLEIYNYRPMTQETAEGEIAKIGAVYRSLEKKDGIEFVLPTDILNLFPIADTVRIESAESPLPCKNRDDYNVLRWAVSGRDDVWFNTECFKIYNKLKTLSFLRGSEVRDCEWEALNLLWGSDLRTKTTNEKHYEGKKQVGAVSESIDAEYSKFTERLEVKGDFLLINPHNEIWEKAVFEYDFKFREGRFKKPLCVKIKGAVVPTQCENIRYFRDGSIRSVRVVFMPVLQPGEQVYGSFEEVSSEKLNADAAELQADCMRVRTADVDIMLSRLTGGDVRQVIFPKVSKKPLFGYLSPVYFDHVGHSNDYFSMDTKIIDSQLGVVNDTHKSSMYLEEAYGNERVRYVVAVKSEIDCGIIWKYYYIYKDFPRVDVRYSFFLDNISPDCFRIGTVTVNPEVFTQKHLQFATVNGADAVEVFPVDGTDFHHNEPVGATASGRCCLGATEGWIDISDHEKGIGIITDKSELYTVPMVEYEEVKNKYLMRVFHSVSEFDESGRIFWRGHNNVTFTILGHRNDHESVRMAAHFINRKLMCFPFTRDSGNCYKPVDVLKK